MLHLRCCRTNKHFMPLCLHRSGVEVPYLVTHNAVSGRWTH